MDIEGGVIFFNSHQYFEAHEEWEKQWRSLEDSPEKKFLQGLIMIAAALHHYRKKEYGGTEKLLKKGIKILKDNRWLSIDIITEDFLRQVTSFYEEFKSSGLVLPDKSFPRINMLARGK